MGVVRMTRDWVTAVGVVFIVFVGIGMALGGWQGVLAYVVCLGLGYALGKWLSAGDTGF